MEIIVYQTKISMQQNPKKQKKTASQCKTKIFFLHFFSSFHINLYPIKLLFQGPLEIKTKMEIVSKAKNRLNAHLFFG